MASAYRGHTIGAATSLVVDNGPDDGDDGAFGLPCLATLDLRHTSAHDRFAISHKEFEVVGMHWDRHTRKQTESQTDKRTDRELQQ